jgi:hypothetical protein
MSKLKICSVIVLTVVLMGAAGAAYGRGGGGGGGGGGRGGGGGGAHFGGGGAHFGGGGHFGGGARVGGGGAHFGGAHFGGGPRFSGSPAVSRYTARPSFRGQRSFAGRGGSGRAASRDARFNANRNANFARDRNPGFQNRSASRRSNAVRSALNSRAVAGALHNRTALRNPDTRARVATSAAIAGWHDGHGGREGWWRHRHGGYGWVGPLFWPFAYYDIYDYALWDYTPFWDYGYNDIYAGLFAPYGYDELTGYLPQAAGSPQTGSRRNAQPAASDQLAQMCGDDSRDIAGLPIDQIQAAIQPNDAQRTALDDFANASVKAGQDIKAACPTQIALTAPARLAAMQQRIEAMISAVGTVRSPLQKFYDLLSDEQKARLSALGEDQRKREAAQHAPRSLAQSCEDAQATPPNWPAGEIDTRIHPTEAQRASLAALQDASTKAADMLKASCQTAEAITPPARLEAAGKRLDTMLQAVKSVRAALDDFYGKLTDEQKAQFEAIGPGRTALSDEPDAARAQVRRHRHMSVAGLIRHFMWLAH